MNHKTFHFEEASAKADVCLGTDWFAPPRRHSVKARLSLRALDRLVGLGSHLIAGMLRLQSHPARRGATRRHRHNPDIER